jgi:hypothetical protein
VVPSILCCPVLFRLFYHKFITFIRHDARLAASQEMTKGKTLARSITRLTDEDQENTHFLETVTYKCGTEVILQDFSITVCILDNYCEARGPGSN